MITNAIHSYETIKEWKDAHIERYMSDSFRLNEFHDKTMVKVFKMAIERLNKGNPPCEFSWFITGSGGRFEQGRISDQDHGLVYEFSNRETDDYFHELGKEISYALNYLGYPYCQGNVMSSNPLWCKPLSEWKGQLFSWMEEASWDTIRNIQIFYDARNLQGNEFYIRELKNMIFDFQKKHPWLLRRCMENVMHIKHGVGPFGQILVEEHGINRGYLNVKYTAFLPYVNAVRLLAIKEGLQETSTIERMNRLIRINGYGAALRESKRYFLALLKVRTSMGLAKTYEDIHYLNIKKLSRGEKKEIKRIIRGGKRLHHYVSDIIFHETEQE